MSYVQGPQGAEQLISPILFMQALNRSSKSVNNDDLEKKLKEYIDSKFSSLERPDVEQIKNAVRDDIKDNLPALFKDANFQTKEAFDAYIKSLNYVLKQTFDAKMIELDKTDSVNIDAIMVLQKRINILEEQIKTLGSSEEVTQAIESIASIKAQIGNTNIKDLNISGLTAKVNSLESQINVVVPLFRDEAIALRKLYEELKEEQEEQNTAYDAIDGELKGAIRRLGVLEKIKHITPDEFEAHKKQIQEEIARLNTSIKLIESINLSISGIEGRLNNLKQISTPDVAPKLESELNRIRTEMASANEDRLKQLEGEIKRIEEKFTAEIEKLRDELIKTSATLFKTLTAELDRKYSTSDEFKALADTIKEYQRLSPANMTLLQNVILGLNQIKGIDQRLQKTNDITKAALETAFTAKVNELKEYIDARLPKESAPGEFILTETPTF